MLILASNSLARRDLLQQAGVQLSHHPADIDERQIEIALGDVKPDLRAKKLAEAKARNVAARFTGDHIIGADQTLWFEGGSLHKPDNMIEARDQLWAMRGKTHQLFSAAVLVQDGNLLWHHVSSVQMRMREFSRQELQRILQREGEALLQCVGAYRIESTSIQLFEEIAGDYFTILGLPLLDLLSALRQHVPQSFSEPS